MKKRIALLLALLMTLSLCACGSSSKMASSTESAAYDSSPMEPAPNAAPASGFATMDSVASAGEYGEYDSGTESGDVPDENPEKIIYSADATVETTDFDKTLEELAALIKEYGGWVQSSSINGANYYSIHRYSSER